MAEIIHIAGPIMQVRSHCRQRCLWCGALIQDIDLNNVAVMQPDGSTRPVKMEDLPSWSGLVKITDDRMYEAVDDQPEVRDDDPESMEVPSGSCMAMPVEETR